MEQTVQGRASGGLLFTIICGCAIAMATMGVRTVFGLFIEPLSLTNGWGRDIFALSLAIQNLCWGMSQPVAGALADRFGPYRILIAGGIVYAAGVAMVPYASSPLMLHLTAGVLCGTGMGMASFIIVLSAFGKLVPAEKRTWAFGLATAASSLGQFTFAPFGNGLIQWFGWQEAALILAGFIVLVPVLATPFRKAHGGDGAAEAQDPLRKVLADALRHPSYIYLTLGFFVCGFHVAFILVHLPPYLSDVGVPSSVAAWALALVGLFNVAGSYFSGVLSGKKPKRHVLSFIYLARSAVILTFIMLPPSTYTVLAFGAVMGILWLSTVAPTSGLVAVMFGTKNMSMLFGIVFLSHQIGAFLGVWLGGAVYERTGSYDIVWWVSIALGVLSAAIHWPIREQSANGGVAESAAA